ncbi:MAG: hypothetical protein ACJA0H_000848 [Francisellaceae bacterium]|jgi:hypothetical protein
MSLVSVLDINTDEEDKLIETKTIRKNTVKKEHNFLYFEEDKDLAYNNTFNKSYLDRYRTR